MKILLNRRAFTLIEVVIVIIILGVLGGLTAAFSFVMFDTLGLVTRHANLQESGLVALSRMSRETRLLRNDESISNATATEFSFVDTNNITITYRQNGTTLEREQSSPAQTNLLADNVNDFTVKYYGEDATYGDGTLPAELVSPTFGIGTRTDIRRIEYLIEFQDGAHTLNAQTTTRPRNLRHESYMFF